MKKILAILSVATMLFAACNPSDKNNTPAAPTFPEAQSITAESGESYEFAFTVSESWSVSLPAESQVYATLTYQGVTDNQFYGEAGEHTIVVNVREGIMSYAKDFVINVEMTIREYTQNIATLTVLKLPYKITVTGSAPTGMEDVVQSTFEEGGHPENGPFASAANTYTVRYLNRSDAKYGDFVVTHDLDLLYNYVVYAKSSADGEFAPISEDCTWLSLRRFGAKREKFSLEMIYDSSDAVLTEGVGYEAYVNLEDENGDALVSVYFIYDPAAVAAPAVCGRPHLRGKSPASSGSLACRQKISGGASERGCGSGKAGKGQPPAPHLFSQAVYRSLWENPRRVSHVASGDGGPGISPGR